jgi:hypothetical protein
MRARYSRSIGRGGVGAQHLKCIGLQKTFFGIESKGREIESDYCMEIQGVIGGGCCLPDYLLPCGSHWRRIGEVHAEVERSRSRPGSSGVACNRPSRAPSAPPLFCHNSIVTVIAKWGNLFRGHKRQEPSVCPKVMTFISCQLHQLRNDQPRLRRNFSAPQFTRYELKDGSRVSRFSIIKFGRFREQGLSCKAQ